ncbi:MAG TPA: hypothetical protein VD816_07800 [Ohtaekwangia sp.]|nr:hypothetical protein [Ohtaekwangia sp.]
MQGPYIEFLQDVLITMHANIRELRERKSFANPEDLTYIEAKLTAYNELLSILRSSADEFGIDRDAIGL